MSTYTDIADSALRTIKAAADSGVAPEVENVTLELHGVAPDRVRDGEIAGAYVAIVRLASGHTAARDGDTKEGAIQSATRAAVSKALRL